MISNDRFYEVLRRIPDEERQIVRRRRNPKRVKWSERDLMFLEFPHNPLRIVERAAERAREKLGWANVSWGIDDESCWIREQLDGRCLLEPIEPGHHRQEAEMHAALRLLASVSRDHNS